MKLDSEMESWLVQADPGSGTEGIDWSWKEAREIGEG